MAERAPHFICGRRSSATAARAKSWLNSWHYAYVTAGPDDLIDPYESGFFRSISTASKTVYLSGRRWAPSRFCADPQSSRFYRRLMTELQALGSRDINANQRSHIPSFRRGQPRIALTSRLPTVLSILVSRSRVNTFPPASRKSSPCTFSGERRPRADAFSGEQHVPHPGGSEPPGLFPREAYFMRQQLRLLPVVVPLRQRVLPYAYRTRRIS